MSPAEPVSADTSADTPTPDNAPTPALRGA